MKSCSPNPLLATLALIAVLAACPEALQIFIRNQPNATQASAETAYRVLLDPKDGFQRRAQIDLKGVASVLAIRSKWAEQKRQFQPPGAYYDGGFYEQAIR